MPNHVFGGRLKGKPNKINGLINEAALMAAEIAGNEFANKDKLPGLVNYLRIAAKTEPVAFLGLLAKILPTQLVDRNGDDDSFTLIKRMIINADGRDYRAIADGETALEITDAERPFRTCQ